MTLIRSTRDVRSSMSFREGQVQYVPRAGQVCASVVARRNGDIVRARSAAYDIEQSQDFGLLNGVELVELLSFALAAIIAVATGFLMFYSKNPDFGSLQDYLALFLWGVGVDQGKNFLQALQTYAPARAT